METRFRCHLTRRKPYALFQLWFYVSVPGFDFETPKVNFTASAASTSETPARLLQRFQFEFLSVEANAGIATREHLVLVGKELGNRSESFAVQPAIIVPASSSVAAAAATADATGPDRTATQRHEISENIRVLLTKFARPFDYSTSSWGSDDDGCRKDISKFVPFGSFESETVEGEEERDEEEEVNVMKTKLGPAFEYLLKSKAKPPSLRLLIPGNVSMLRWWFKDQGVSLASGSSSLRVKLSHRPEDGQSQILIRGNLTGCPGYLSIIVTDRTSGDELLNYDVLVSCPSPEFNVTFYLPDSGGGGGGGDDDDVTARRVYELQVDDTKSVRRLLLVRSPARSPPRSCAPSSATTVTEHDRTLALAAAAGDDEVLLLLLAAGPGRRRRSTYEAPLGVALVAVVCSFVVYVIAASVTSSSSRAAKKNRRRNCAAASGRSPSKPESSAAREWTTSPCCGGDDDRRRALGIYRRVQRLFVAVYVLTRFAYNVLAFSAFYVLLTVSFRRHFDRSTAAAAAASVRQSAARSDVLYGRLVSEPYRHLRSSLARGGRRCDADEFVGVFLKDGAAAAAQVTRPRSAVLQQGGAAEIWNRSLEKYGDEARRFLTDVRDRLGRVLKRSSRKYDRFVRGVFSNDWFAYPLRLFSVNASYAVLQGGEGSPGWTSFSRGLEKMEQWYLDFAVFLGIEEIPANEILNEEILNRCKDLGAVSFLESFQIRARNGFLCDSTIGSEGRGGEGGGGGGGEQERSPKSLDSFDSTRYYSSFDVFSSSSGDQIRSQDDGGGGLTTPPPPPPMTTTTFKLTQKSPEIATGSAKRRDPDLSRAFADALEPDSTSCDRLIAVLIALDFVVIIRRMLRLYEKFRSFQRHCDDCPPPSKENTAYGSSCDLGGGDGEGQGYPMTTATDLNHTGSGAVFHSISSKLGPDEMLLDEETVVFDDDDDAAAAAAYRTRCDSTFDGKTENDVEKEDSNSHKLLEILFSGFLHDSAIIPELVVTAVVMALLVTGMTVLSRRRDIFQMDDRFWTPIVYLWKSWTNDTEEASQTMELEGNIRSELVYLDATIAHLCSGHHWRLASGLSHEMLNPVLCLLGNAASGDNATSDTSWEKKISSTAKLLAASLQHSDNLDVLSNGARFECCDVIAVAVRATLDLALTLIAVSAGLRSLSWTVELIVTRLCPSSYSSSSSTSGHATTEEHVTSSSSASKWIGRTVGADDSWCFHEVTYLHECCPYSVDGCLSQDHSGDGQPPLPHQPHRPCCPPLPPQPPPATSSSSSSSSLGGRCCLAQRTRRPPNPSNAPITPQTQPSELPCEESFHGSGQGNSHPHQPHPHPHHPLSEECSESTAGASGGSSSAVCPQHHPFHNPLHHRRASVHLLRRVSSVPGSLVLRTAPPPPSNRTERRMRSVDFYPCAYGSEANDDDGDRRRSRRRSQKGVRFLPSSFSETIV